MERKEISQAVVSRLPRYYRYLGELRDEGVERISSQELSKKMQVTASQIRQDLNHFGGFGQQGYGYNVEYLYVEIAKILISFAASVSAIQARIPIREKSSVPHTLNPLQPSSRATVLSGTISVGQTSEFSSSVVAVKTKG